MTQKDINVLNYILMFSMEIYLSFRIILMLITIPFKYVYTTKLHLNLISAYDDITINREGKDLLMIKRKIMGLLLCIIHCTI